MRTSTSLLALLACALLLGAPLAGCGGSHRVTATAGGQFSETSTLVTTRLIPPGQRLRGDGDADNPGDIDGNGDVDPSKDRDADRPVPGSYRLPDSDDGATYAFGRAASAAERRVLVALVERYYAAARGGDGAAACSLLPAGAARTAPETYGVGGPLYLRGGKTCAAIATLLFRHLHSELTDPPTVLETRVRGRQALAIVSSRSLRASDLSLIRAGGSWRVENLFGQALP